MSAVIPAAVKGSVVDLAPFWNGIANDPLLAVLAARFDECYDKNGGCQLCPVALGCRRLWGEAVVASVKQGCLRTEYLRKFAIRFEKLKKGY